MCCHGVQHVARRRGSGAQTQTLTPTGRQRWVPSGNRHVEMKRTVILMCSFAPEEQPFFFTSRWHFPVILQTLRAVWSALLIKQRGAKSDCVWEWSDRFYDSDFEHQSRIHVSPPYIFWTFWKYDRKSVPGQTDLTRLGSELFLQVKLPYSTHHILPVPLCDITNGLLFQNWVF